MHILLKICIYSQVFSLVICPIAIAYGMGQNIKSVCRFVGQCICVSLCEHFHGRISWSIFTKIGTDVRTPKRKNEFIRGQYIESPFPHFAPKPLFQDRRSWKSMQICFKCTEIVKILAYLRKSGSTRWWCQILDRKSKYCHFTHAQ